MKENIYIYKNYLKFSPSLTAMLPSLGRQTYSADDTLKLLPTNFSLITWCPWINFGKCELECF